MTEDNGAIEAVKKKMSNGWEIIKRYSCGIQYWRFIKGNKESNYPRINEDLFCDLLCQKVIKSRPTNLDTPVYYILNNQHGKQ